MNSSAKLGLLSVGHDFPVRIMAAINVGPESFYKGSVASTPRKISAAVRNAVADGADIVDIGAMSSAPHLDNQISAQVELARMHRALAAVEEPSKITISVDTSRASVADAALRNGASIINDVSGLKHDANMGRVIRERGGSLLAMAHSPKVSGAKPIARIRQALKETLQIADKEGIERRRIVLDPGIGFFAAKGTGFGFSPQNVVPWFDWNYMVLAELGELESLGRPLCVGVSRKAFLTRALGLRKPEERLPASLAATAIAVMNGASMIRTHDVKETVQAVRIAEAIAKARGRREGRVF